MNIYEITEKEWRSMSWETDMVKFEYATGGWFCLTVNVCVKSRSPSRIACERKVLSLCKRLRLVATQELKGVEIEIHSQKDLGRIKTIFSFVQGRKFAKTYRNNIGTRKWRSC